jgi:hypothetical protein
LSGPAMLPSRPPAEKRPRQETPTKEQRGTDWQGRINGDMEWAKTKVGEAVLAFKTDKIVNLASSVTDFFNGTLVSIFERQASTLSDLCGELNQSKDANVKLTSELEKVKEELDQAKMCRTKVEAKTSKRDMEDKVKISVTQFKVSDLNVGGAIADRKELAEAAKKAMAAKVRSDLRKAFDEKIKHATFKVLANKPFKRQDSNGGEFWTAPVLVTIQDRENRWEVENMLRKSNVFPGFHWPKEMVDSVKAYRQVVADMGYSDNDYYVRIRPEERDGSMRVRADVKPKGSMERFVPLASFELPPLDENLKKNNSDWTKPVWVNRLHSQASAQAVQGAAQIDFTEDVDISEL